MGLFGGQPLYMIPPVEQSRPFSFGDIPIYALKKQYPNLNLEKQDIENPKGLTQANNEYNKYSNYFQQQIDSAHSNIKSKLEKNNADPRKADIQSDLMAMQQAKKSLIDLQGVNAEIEKKKDMLFQQETEMGKYGSAEMPHTKYDPIAKAFVPDTIVRKDEYGNARVTYRTLQEVLNEQKDDPSIIFDERKKSFSVTPVISDDYDIVEPYSVFKSKIFDTASRALKSSSGPVYDKNGNFSYVGINDKMEKNPTDGSNQATFLINSSNKSNIKAVNAARDQLYEVMQSNDKAKKSMAAYFSQSLFSDDSAELFKLTAEPVTDKNGNIRYKVNKELEELVIKIRQDQPLEIKDRLKIKDLQKNFVANDIVKEGNLYYQSDYQTNLDKIKGFTEGGMIKDAEKSFEQSRTDPNVLNERGYVNQFPLVPFRLTKSDGTEETQYQYQDWFNPIDKNKTFGIHEDPKTGKIVGVPFTLTGGTGWNPYAGNIWNFPANKVELIGYTGHYNVGDKLQRTGENRITNKKLGGQEVWDEVYVRGKWDDVKNMEIEIPDFVTKPKEVIKDDSFEKIIDPTTSRNLSRQNVSMIRKLFGGAEVDHKIYSKDYYYKNKNGDMVDPFTFEEANINGKMNAQMMNENVKKKVTLAEVPTGMYEQLGIEDRDKSTLFIGNDEIVFKTRIPGDIGIDKYYTKEFSKENTYTDLQTAREATKKAVLEAKKREEENNVLQYGQMFNQPKDIYNGPLVKKSNYVER